MFWSLPLTMVKIATGAMAMAAPPASPDDDRDELVLKRELKAGVENAEALDAAVGDGSGDAVPDEEDPLTNGRAEAQQVSVDDNDYLVLVDDDGRIAAPADSVCDRGSWR